MRLIPRSTTTTTPFGGFGLKNSGGNGRSRTSIRRAINGSSSPRGRSAAQEKLLGWRRKLESGWRRELPTKRIYVTTVARTKSGTREWIYRPLSEALLTNSVVGTNAGIIISIATTLDHQ